MTMAPLAVAHLLRDRGIESTLQIAGRDRNRLAIQADMLAAHALGVENVVCMTGDPPSGGDHPDAKPVFDLGAEDILRAASSLEAGKDLAGNALKDRPRFYRGAVTNVAVPDLGKEVARMEAKIASGAQFFQTNAVYEPAAFERFMERCDSFQVPILAGIIVLKSARQARYMTERIPGRGRPGSHDRGTRARVEIRPRPASVMTSDVIREVAPMCHGVHVMAIGWERYIPDIARSCGALAPPTRGRGESPVGQFRPMGCGLRRTCSPYLRERAPCRPGTG